MAVSIERKPIYRTVWFALLVCGVLLALSLVPFISQWIEYVDQHAAIWLNHGAGDSPVFDRFVLLIADDDGRERIVFLAIIWFLVTLYMAPSRVEKSRLMGTLLFISVVLLLYFLVDSLLDDVIERKSPSMEFLQPFHNIGKILDFSVDLKDRRSFPNFEAMILFTMSFILLRLRRFRGGFVAFVMGATAPLMLCVAGLCWVSDIYLGSLPLALLVSAVAVETPFYRLHARLVELSAAGIDQRERLGRVIGPMWRHRKLYWISQNVFHMEVAVKRFAARDLPSIIDREKLYRHESTQLEVPLGGLKSVIRIASLGPLKAVLRAYPVNRRYEADQHYKASRMLADHGIRVPAIYHKTDNPYSFGALFIVEEFIEGCSKAPSELTDEDISAAALELARLHKVTSEVWGPVKAPRTEDYPTVLLRRLDRQLIQVCRGPILRGAQPDLAIVRAWFAGWRGELESIRRFALVHGKLHRENCIFEAGGGFCLLDITTLEWGVAASDLVLVHHSQFGRQADLIARFDATYFANSPKDAAGQTRRLLPLYEAVYCLSQVSKYTKRIGRTHRRPVGDAISKGTKWWRRLMEIVEGAEIETGESLP